MKNLLLINGFGSNINIINELLSNKLIDINFYLSYPLGVLTLAGWVKEKLPEFNLQIIDVQIDLHKKISTSNRKSTTLNQFISEELLKVNFIPDYIAISLSFSNGHEPCLKMIDMCKDRWPQSKIIVGGMHATTFTSKVISDSNIDFVIRGPADISFIDLLRSLEENKNPEKIKGVVTKHTDITPISCSYTDLDNMPFYPYDMIDMEYLVKNESTAPISEKGSRTGLVQMSRGCPFSCTYCSASLVHGKKVFFKSINRILNEIEYLVDNYKINQLCIIDDLFGADKKYFFKFFQELENRKYNFRLVIPAGLSFAIFDEEMVDVLVKHRLKAINFPLESGSQYVQDFVIKKHVNLQKAKKLIDYTKKKGLFVGINIVIGSPGETKKHMFETYEFIKTLPVDWTSFFVAYPYPGTEMTETLLKRGDLTEDKLINIWADSAQGFKERPFDTIEITGKELSKLTYDFNIELNFFNNYNFQTKDYNHILPKLNKIVERYPFHVVALVSRARCYYGLGKLDKAKEDIKNMFNLIKTNSDSNNMYEKYKKKIEKIVNDINLTDIN